MPELPEVEAITRTLRPLICGQRIRCVHIFHAIATKPQSPVQLVKLCQARQVKEVWRRGKYLFLELDRGLVEMHF
jgi:formamidopyrimidine-DNA glycosylase